MGMLRPMRAPAALARLFTGEPRYSLLLFLLLVLIVAAPLVPTGPRGYGFELSFNLVLFAGTYSVAAETRYLRAFVILTALTFALRWTHLAFEGDRLFLLASTLSAVWIGYVFALMAAVLFRITRVTTNAIFAAIVVYLLAALGFAVVFQIVARLDPEAFSGLSGAQGSALGDALLYFSLVCVTTMGYGDILPVSAFARQLSALEGAFGALYLAVMVARLVALHILSGEDAVDE